MLQSNDADYGRGWNMVQMWLRRLDSLEGRMRILAGFEGKEGVAAGGADAGNAYMLEASSPNYSLGLRRFLHSSCCCFTRVMI
jgi:hypothetical protein